MGTLGSEKTDNTSNDGSSQNPIVVTNISRENPTTDISALGDPQSTMGVQMEKKSKASVVENGSSSFPMPPKAVSSKTVQSGAQQAEKTSIKSTGQNVTTSNKQSNVNANSGNDRVTVDKSHAPLVPSSNQGIAAQKAVESSSVTTTSNTSVTQVGISTISATPTNSNSEPKTPGSLKAPASPSNPAPPSPIDEQAVIEEAIRKSRAPLADKYGPYIVNSDTTLEEARSRLRTAIEQTRQLRSAFTERVYGKYRVCLRPPPSTEEMLTEILSDPEYTSREYFAEIKSLKEEKDIEKKESQKLNAEMMAATSNGEGNPLAAMNAENAEQLMFIGAGLSLIILPEQDVSDINMSGYKDRAPINPETGQRVRAISQAAAAAGEVMLDRARKGSAMREERMRRRQLKLLQGEDPENSADNNYSRLSLLSSSAAAAAIPVQKPSVPTVATGAVVQNAVATVPSTKATAGTPAKAIAPAPILISKNTVKKAAPKPPPSTLPSPANVKAIRARVQASMSVQTLLSLSPSAEELRIDGKTSAATMALLERGVGTRGVGLSSKTNQLRYRHPFPESHGGRRRSMGPGAALKKDSNTAADAFLQPSSYISMALPPLPTARERRMKKKIGVLESSKACSSRARTAIRSVLDQFVDGEWKETNDLAAGSDNFMRPKKRRISEISFLHGIQKIGDGVDSNEAESSSPKTPPLLAVTSPIEKSIDPILAFNVLKAVGMIKPSTSETDMETRRFDAGFDLSLFGVAEKRAMGEEGGQSRRSIGKLRSLWKKFSTKKRTFLEAFSNPITEEKLETTAPGTAEKEKSNQSQQEKPNTSEKDPVPIRETVTKPSNEASNMLETGANGTHENSEAQKKESKSEPIQSPPTVAIRGGGESLKDTSDRDKKSGQSQGAGQQPMNGALNNPDAVGSQGQVVRRNGPMNLPTADMATHRMVWDEGSHQPIVLINPQLGRAEQGYALTPASHPAHLIQHANGAAQAQRNARMQGMQSAEHYHHHTTNAIQLANHLRHATAAIQRVPPHGHPAAGDLETYIGGLHSQPAGAYDWSSINAANAAVAATHNSLAALGINPQRAAMVNFSVQDRARVLLAREQQHAAAAAAAHAAAAHRQQSLSSQQAVAFLGGAAANHGYPQTANPHFQHMAGPTTTAALLNSSAALMGHSGMAQVQSTNVQQPARLQPVNPDQRNAIVTKSDQSPNKDGDRMDHASSKEEGSIKDQQKEAAKRENAQKKDSSVGQKTSISRADIPANRKRALSDQDKIDAQPLKRGSSSEKQNKQTNSEPKNSSAASSVTKSAQRKPAPAPFLQGAQAPLPNKGGSQSGNDRKEKPGASDAPSQIKAKSEVSKDNSNTASTLAIPQKNTISSESTSDIHMDDASSTGQQRTGGMKFFVPPAPPGIPAEVARFVLAGKSHKAIEFMENSETPTDATALVEYLIAVGTAVPIPKALVATAFKERMSAPGPKSNSLGGIPALSREVSEIEKILNVSCFYPIRLSSSLLL